MKNKETDTNIDDLIRLPYLHEPAILYCLEKRYEIGEIYTYTGPILIALNPFKQLPIYSNHTLEQYYNHGLLLSQGIDPQDKLKPHVYAIADAAYREMMNIVIHGSNVSQSSTVGDQVILIYLIIYLYIIFYYIFFNCLIANIIDYFN